MNVADLKANAMVHDPFIFPQKQGDTYYIFGTHMTLAASRDLRHWEQIHSEDVSPQNTLFKGLFSGPAFDYCGKFNDKYYGVWAPDVSYNPYLKKYVMYVSLTGSYVKSSIAMATADKLEGPYRYECALVSSGFSRSTEKLTNLKQVLGPRGDTGRYYKRNGNYNNFSYPNCIDPNTFFDKDGRLWMVYGSWSGGIFLLELDKRTGKAIYPKADKQNRVDPYFGRHLLGGGHKSMEGPFIIYDAVSDWYYLFVSVGWLSREGGYQIRLFRSKNPEGPYVDGNGKTFGRVPDHGPYGVKLMGAYSFPSQITAYKSMGHNSVLAEDGRLYMVYHQRFDNGTERHEPRVHQLLRTEDGWLTAAPFATAGERVTDRFYDLKDVAGAYELVCHVPNLDSKVNRSRTVQLRPNGQLLQDGKVIGTMTLCKAAGATVRLGGVDYRGRILEGMDDADNPVTCFTGIGGNNSLWLVRYDQEI